MNFTTTLLPHQQQAYDKLHKFKVGALYMEQGTGKSRTIMEIVEYRRGQGKIDAVLWLCPCSARQNIKDEIAFQYGKFQDYYTVRGIESVAASDRLYAELLEFVSSRNVFLIIDESNMIKNPFAKRTRRIGELAKHCPYKFILNGTPVSKNEADLYAQWYVLDWRILGYQSYYSFSRNHLEYYTIRTPDGREVTTDQVKRVLDVPYLTQKISPFSYQVLKEECLELPEKIYRGRWFCMTAQQRSHYEDVHARFLENVDEFRSETIYKLFTALQHVSAGRFVGSRPADRMRTIDMFDDINDNPRIQCLNSVLDEIGEEKVIIFAKYQSEIKEIEQLISDRGGTYVEFTGKVKPAKRNEAVQAFRKDVQYFVANKQCGAYSLNLQFCHYMIFYDNDFDYATRQQAEDRIHRIGQTKEVYIYDIYANRGIDEFIRGNLSSKDSLVSALKDYVDKYKNQKPEDYEKEQTCF